MFKINGIEELPIIQIMPLTIFFIRLS